MLRCDPKPPNHLHFLAEFFIIFCNIFTHLNKDNSPEMINLTQAPYDKQLKIVEIIGGHNVRRRLLSLGFHKNHIIELDSRSILKGPILVRDLISDTSIALGRGIAQKIMVEIVGETE
jgi:Fe2+ transport system protein FeoA